MHGGGYPTDQLAIVKQRHDHRLVRVVDSAVTRVVVDESVAFTYPNGRVLRPVLVDELHRILAHRGKRCDSVRRNFRKISREREASRTEIAPLRTGRGAHLFYHVEAFQHRRLHPPAHLMQDVRVTDPRHRLLFASGTGFEFVVAHDLRIRSVEQTVLLQESLD